jgi:hypothetical protein
VHHRRPLTLLLLPPLPADKPSNVVLVECVDIRRILEDRGDVVQQHFTELFAGWAWAWRAQVGCHAVDRMELIAWNEAMTKRRSPL